MRTRVFKTKLVPEGRILAITLFGFIFTRHPERVDKYVFNHERIHCRQQLEWLYLPFFVAYGAEWLYLFIKYRNWHKAYRNISFEREAYDNEYNLRYLDSRKPFQTFRRSHR